MPRRGHRRPLALLLLLALAGCSSAITTAGGADGPEQTAYPPPSGRGPIVVLLSGHSGPGHYQPIAGAVAKLGYYAVLLDGKDVLTREQTGAPICARPSSVRRRHRARCPAGPRSSGSRVVAAARSHMPPTCRSTYRRWWPITQRRISSPMPRSSRSNSRCPCSSSPAGATPITTAAGLSRCGRSSAAPASAPGISSSSSIRTPSTASTCQIMATTGATTRPTPGNERMLRRHQPLR